MICAGESVRLILTWLEYYHVRPIAGRRETLKLNVLVMALLIFGVPAPTREATVDNQQIETINTLCVVDVTRLPVPVLFEKSMTLTQAIKQAAIAREDICGLRLRPLMHGGFVLFPKEWSPSNEPSEKNRDPNNQKS